jgi:hypothetical protein
MKARKKNKIKFAVCINDSEPDLELRKIYKVLPDEAPAKDRHLRVIHEFGEDYLYPATFFVFVEVPKAAERNLLLASAGCAQAAFGRHACSPRIRATCRTLARLAEA